MGHWQGFTAIYAGGGICGIFPRRHDPNECFRSAAMFYVVPVAMIRETMVYMGLRAISEVVLKVVTSILCNCA
eukprot:1310226-Pleurochrysis_carterae.AAC.2